MEALQFRNSSSVSRQQDVEPLYFQMIITATSHLRVNILGYLSVGIICSEKRTVFRKRNSRKTLSVVGQIMYKNKYPSIFSRQMEAVMLIVF